MANNNSKKVIGGDGQKTSPWPNCDCSYCSEMRSKERILRNKKKLLEQDFKDQINEIELICGTCVWYYPLKKYDGTYGECLHTEFRTGKEKEEVVYKFKSAKHCTEHTNKYGVTNE